MKTCTMCATEKEDVTMVQVAPGTWNGFHNYAEVCTECQASRRYKAWAKPKTSRAAPKSSTEGTSTAEAPGASGGTATSTGAVQIAHRRTGALLHVVDNHTLAGASLSGAALSGANLNHATMRGADLHRADLHLADLSGADLRDADLRGVNFRGADLRGADLREARLYKADLNHALYDAATRWPSGFDPNTCGARKEGRSG